MDVNDHTTNPVTTATCTKCGVTYPLTKEFFPLSKTCKTGYQGACRHCACNRAKSWRAENPDKVRDTRKRYRAENVSKQREYDKRYRDENPDKVREYAKRWRAENPERVSDSRKRWRQNNPEKVKEYRKRWRAENPDKAREIDKRYRAENADMWREKSMRWRQANPERVRENAKRWQHENPEKLRENAKRWFQENPEKARENSKRWHQANPGKKQEYRHLRRARVGGNAGNFTAADSQRMFEYFDHKCAVCGRSADLFTTIAVDHWIPLARGGSNTPDNCVPLCHTKHGGGSGNGCNNSKHARDPQEWLTEKFGKRKAAKILARIHAYFTQLQTEQENAR